MTSSIDNEVTSYNSNVEFDWLTLFCQPIKFNHGFHGQVCRDIWQDHRTKNNSTAARCHYWRDSLHANCNTDIHSSWRNRKCKTVVLWGIKCYWQCAKPFCSTKQYSHTQPELTTSTNTHVMFLYLKCVHMICDVVMNTLITRNYNNRYVRSKSSYD